MVLNPNRPETRIGRATDVDVPVISDINGLPGIEAQSLQARQKNPSIRLRRNTSFAGDDNGLKEVCKLGCFNQTVFL